jgi:hypothetical protein
MRQTNLSNAQKVHTQLQEGQSKDPLSVRPVQHTLLVGGSIAECVS